MPMVGHIYTVSTTRLIAFGGKAYRLQKKEKKIGNDTHNTTQHNDNTIHLIAIFTDKTMAEVLGAVASAMTVVQVAGKVWSTVYKYYQVRIRPQAI